MTDQTLVPNYREIFFTFGKIGLISFGGPAAQIAMLQRIIVDEKKWMDQERLLHALNFCMLLPGPEAMQLATYCGWILRGWRGGLLAGLLFVLPGAAVMLAFSALYVMLGHVDIVAGLLFGLKAAVLAIIFEALYRMGKRTLTTGFSLTVAILAFLAISFLNLSFPLVIALAALAGGVRHALWCRSPETNGLSPISSKAISEFIKQTLIWTSLWLIPLAAILLSFGLEHVFATEALFFSKLAAVSFGGAYAALSYTLQVAAEQYGWMQPDEMLTGLGLAETTPGPLILVLVFVGFVGAANLSGYPGLWGGVAGGLIALWFTFVPCFLWIFAGAPFVERFRQVRWLAAMLSGISAAVVGVIGSLALWFSLNVIFSEVAQQDWGLFTVPMPIWNSADGFAVMIAVFAAWLLIGLKNKPAASIATSGRFGNSGPPERVLIS